ncbi:MAG: hypothetical protein HC917_18215 [Richelia sp. SM2_1_7]|nr:hypothetical protein [Richelia sp. SM2_1_7]
MVDGYGFNNPDFQKELESWDIEDGTKVTNLEEVDDEQKENKEEEEDILEEVIPLYKNIAEKIEFELEDFSKYSEDENGLVSFITDYKNKIQENIEDEIYNEIEERSPLIARMIEEVYSNERSVENVILEYAQMLQYQPVEFLPDNIEYNKELVRNELRNLGVLTEEEIEVKLESMQDNGSLLPRAKNIIDTYNNNIQYQRSAILQQEYQRKQLLKQKQDQQVNVLLNTIKSKKLNNITIPEKDLPKFVSYLNERINIDSNGDLYIKVPVNDAISLENEFIKYRGGITGINDIIGLKANTEVAKRLFKPEKKKEEDMINKLFGHIKK